MNAVADKDTVSVTDFARLVSLHLRLSGRHADEAGLEDWLAGRWPDVVEDMEPARWARVYGGAEDPR